jgi:tetratricopeptide (TPR) repeat protein
LAAIKRARESDPLNLRINALEARMLHYAGRSDEAVEKARQTLELDPNYWFAHMWASAAYTEKGMFAEAVAAVHQARQLWRTGSHASAFEGYTLARWGKQAEARQMLAEMIYRSTDAVSGEAETNGREGIRNSAESPHTTAYLDTARTQHWHARSASRRKSVHELHSNRLGPSTSTAVI